MIPIRDLLSLRLDNSESGVAFDAPQNFLRNNITGATYTFPQEQMQQAGPQLDYSSAPVEIAGVGRGYRMKGDPFTVILSDGRIARLGQDTGANQARQMAQLKMQQEQQKLGEGDLDRKIKQAQLDELMGIDPSARMAGAQVAGGQIDNRPVGIFGPVGQPSPQPEQPSGFTQKYLQKKYGPVPVGFRRTQSGGMEIEPGSPADMEKKAAEKKESLRADTLIKQTESVLDEVTKAKDLVGYSTVGVGGVLSNIPMTDARKLAGHLKTIKANLGFDRLQQMRDMSPTGGALGQVAVQELEGLQSSVAALDQLQSPADVQEALKKIDGHYRRWKSVLGGKPQSETVAPQGTKAQQGNTVALPDGRIKIFPNAAAAQAFKQAAGL